LLAHVEVQHVPEVRIAQLPLGAREHFVGVAVRF
jgi:hypothetical protein